MKSYEERLQKENEVLELISKAKDILMDLDDDEEDRAYSEALDVFYSTVRRGHEELHKIEYRMMKGFDFYNTHS